MKNILFTLALLISFISFGQALTPNQMGMKDKTYKKIARESMTPESDSPWITMHT